MKVIGFIFTFSLTLLLFLLAGDGFVQLTRIAPVATTQYDQSLGRTPIAGSFLFFNEGFGIGRFNEYGHIGPARSPLKSPKTYRVAVIGDSYVEGFQVFERDHFISIAEKELNSQFPDKEIEILNFGRSGFDITSSYALHKLYVDSFTPDLIIYLIAAADLKPEVSDPLMARARLENGQLVIANSFPEENFKMILATQPLRTSSSFINMLNAGRKKAQVLPIGSILFGKFHTLFSGTGSSTPAKTNTDKALDAVVPEIVESLNPRQVVFLTREGPPVAQEFLDLLKRRGIRVHDLNPALLELQENGIHPSRWEASGKTGHWNHHGHEVVAGELKKIVTELISAP